MALEADLVWESSPLCELYGQDIQQVVCDGERRRSVSAVEVDEMVGGGGSGCGLFKDGAGCRGKVWSARC